MKTVGLMIHAGKTTKRWRFVAKVGSAPARCVLNGLVICYKEGTAGAEVVNGMVGLDLDAWDKAQELGASHLTVYLTDRRELYVASLKAFKDHGFTLDLGSGRERRINKKHCKFFPDTPRLDLGFVPDADCVYITHSSRTREVEDEDDQQPTLF